jgi:tetratricopeptide (TPR) repeat protein
MKKNYLFKTLVVGVLIIAASLYFFYRNVQDPIPPLKERSGPISVTSEWLNTKAAIEGLQKKLREKPNDLQSKLLLAFAYMQEARITGDHPYYFPAALKLVNVVLDRETESPVMRYEASVAKASIQLSLHHFSEALATGKEALKINERGAAVYGVLCDALVELGDYEGAIAMADKMTSLRPDLKSYSRISYLREIHGDLPGAIQAMEMAASAGLPGLEQTAWSRVTLGSLYEKTGDLQTATVQYQRALAEYPKYAFALGGLGRIADKNKNTEDAIQLFTEAANTLPEFSFQEELIRLYQEQNRPARANEIMTEMIAGMEEDQEAGHIVDLELANIYLNLKKDKATALAYAMEEYKRRPENIEVNKTLAAIYYGKKDFKKAAQHLQKATRTNSQDPMLLCLDGLVKYRLGDQLAGETQIRKSLANDPFQNNTFSTEGRTLLGQQVSKL